MNKRSQFKLEFFTILLLLVVVTLIVFSKFFFTYSLDQIVHGDLYRYGLQFSSEWVEQYWTYSRLMQNSLDIAMFATGISMALILVQIRTRRNYFKLISCPILIFGTFMIGLSVFFFTRLDLIVNGDLYRYGLQFSYEWAEPYWTCTKLILGLYGMAITANAVGITTILAERINRIHLFLSTQSLLNYVLFFTGALALALSINFNSSTLAFVGLGLVFWGAIFFYVRPSKSVKDDLVQKMTAPSLASLDQIIRKLGYDGKGVYLPPKYVRDFESSKVFIGAQREMKLPSPEQTQDEEDKVFLKNPEGMLVIPPGLELARLFEEKLGTSFARVDLQHFEQKMPRLFVEDLEIAQNAQIETVNNIVHVKIENSIYKDMCKEAKKFSNMCCLLGCPLCSAIACALAKVTGKPVIIEDDQTSEDGKIIDIEYRLLEEAEEKTQ